MEVSGTNKLILPKDIILADRERERTIVYYGRVSTCGLVQSLDWLDLSKLNDVEDIIREVFSKDTDETYIDENRINAVVNAVKRRIQNLEQIIRERQSEIFAHSYSSTEDDVEENVAEDYSPKMEL